MGRDYTINESVMDMYQSTFDLYDQEIVNAPFIEYKQDNLPDYYPEYGIWFNDQDVSMMKSSSNNQGKDAEELEELEKLEQDGDFNKRRK